MIAILYPGIISLDNGHFQFVFLFIFFRSILELTNYFYMGIHGNVALNNL